MELVNHLLYGFGMAFIAVTLPGMVNMTAVSSCIHHGLPSGIKYSFGASITILFQAMIAVVFAGYLAKHPEVFLFLKQAAVVIFLILSVVFLRQALQAKVAKASSRRGHPILIGIIIAAMNPLTIPYFFTVSSFLEVNEHIVLVAPYKWGFIAGAFLGAQAMLGGYAYFAQFIVRRANYLARNLNFILSGLFLVLAFIQMVQLYYE